MTSAVEPAAAPISAASTASFQAKASAMTPGLPRRVSSPVGLSKNTLYFCPGRSFPARFVGQLRKPLQPPRHPGRKRQRTFGSAFIWCCCPLHVNRGHPSGQNRYLVRPSSPFFHHTLAVQNTAATVCLALKDLTAMLQSAARSSAAGVAEPAAVTIVFRTTTKINAASVASATPKKTAMKPELPRASSPVSRTHC